MMKTTQTEVQKNVSEEVQTDTKRETQGKAPKEVQAEPGHKTRRGDSAKKSPRASPLNRLQRAARSNRVDRLLEDYLQSCHATEDGENGKPRGEKFPNLAGFCRFLKCGVGEAEELRQSHPELYDRMCAVLEDEALNSKVSPTLLSVYLKRRLSYGDKPEGEGGAKEPCKLIFEHDILEDGI